MKRTLLVALALFSLFYSGVVSAEDELVLTLPDMAVRRFYKGEKQPKKTTLVKPEIIKIDGEIWVKYRLLSKAIAYRNDKRQQVKFEVPDLFGRSQSRIRIRAYNDDSSWLRCLHLDLDGTGGYLGAQHIGGTEWRGSGTMTAKSKKKWLADLREIQFRQANGKSKNLQDVLRKPGTHTFCTWISTYGQYGPNSTVTLDLEFKIEL